MDTYESDHMLFTREPLTFHSYGSLTVRFLGIKNDPSRSGLEVTIPAGDVVKLDPIKSLKEYVAKTASVCASHNAVFIALKQPYAPLVMATVDKIIDEAIDLVGLGNLGFSANSFHPTGMTAVVKNGVYPNVVMEIGRWTTCAVFMDHYVHGNHHCLYV